MLKLLDKAISWLETSEKDTAAAVQKQAFRSNQKTQRILEQEVAHRKEEIREIRTLQDRLRQPYQPHPQNDKTL